MIALRFLVVIAILFLSIAPQARADETLTSLTPGAGEIRLDGTVETIDVAAKELVLRTQSYTLPSGKTARLLETKSKRVVLSEATVLRLLENADSTLTLGDLTIGIATVVVGRDLGSSRELPARVVGHANKGRPIIDALAAKVQVSTPVAELIEPGMEALSQHRYTDALEFFRRAENQAALLGDLPGQALARSHMALCYRVLQRPQKAMELYQKVLEYHRFTGDRRGQAHALFDVTVTQHALQDFEKALETAKQGLELARDSGDEQMQAHLLQNLGYVSGNMENGQVKRLEYLQQALALWKRLDNRDQQKRVLTSIGHSQMGSRKYAEAIEMYQQAIALGEQGQNPDALGELYNLIGVAWTRQQKYDKAIAAFEQSLPLRKRHSTQVQVATVLSNLAFAQGKSNQHKAAVDTLQNVLPILRELKNKQSELSELRALASAHLNLKQQDQAIKVLEQALPLAVELKKDDEAIAIQRQLDLLRSTSSPALANE